MQRPLSWGCATFGWECCSRALPASELAVITLSCCAVLCCAVLCADPSAERPTGSRSISWPIRCAHAQQSQ